MRSPLPPARGTSTRSALQALALGGLLSVTACGEVGHGSPGGEAARDAAAGSCRPGTGEPARGPATSGSECSPDAGATPDAAGQGVDGAAGADANAAAGADARATGDAAEHQVDGAADAEAGPAGDSDAGNTPDATGHELDASVEADAGPAGATEAGASADACAAPSLVLVPWAWGQRGPDPWDGGGVGEKTYCGGWPESTEFSVWLLQNGSPVLATTVLCDDRGLKLSSVAPGQYEVAILSAGECNQIGAGGIPIPNQVSPLCGGACDAVAVTVEPCGVSRVEFLAYCDPICDDACGGA